jgi:hypothetical protein
MWVHGREAWGEGCTDTALFGSFLMCDSRADVPCYCRCQTMLSKAKVPLEIWEKDVNTLLLETKRTHFCPTFLLWTRNLTPWSLDVVTVY